MNHFGSRVVSLLLAVLFLLGAAGISFYAVFKGTLVFAESAGRVDAIFIATVWDSATNKLNTSSPQKITIEFTSSDLKDASVNNLSLEFDRAEPMQIDSSEPTKFEQLDAATGKFKITTFVNLSTSEKYKSSGKIIDKSGSASKEYEFDLDYTEWLPSVSPEPGTNPDVYKLQSYRFYDDDGDLITKLTKNKKIDKLVVTLKDGGFTKETYDSTGKSGFTASLNYDTFDPKDRDMEPRFSNTATSLPDGCVSYTVTFYDLRYTGDTKELVVKIGYPQSFGLERREFTETLPEGELYEKSASSSSSEESSSEVEIDPPTPRLIIKSYDYGGENVSAGSTATLNMTFQNVSKRVPVDNVVLKVTMPEGFTLTDSSNTFYFERIGREREESISINFTVKPTAEAISQPIKLSFAFEAIIANKRTPLTSDEEIAIPVSQVNRMMLNSVEAPPEIYLGDNNNSIEVSFVNKGKTPVYNVSASIEGENLAQVGQNQFIGNVESGIEKTADFALEALEAGPVTGEIILTYEDANMHVTELRSPFSTQALEMDMGPTQEELDAMNQPQTEPVEAVAWYRTIPAWYWAAGGLVALIVLAYLVKLTRVSRLTILEDDDEDF